MAPCSTDLCEPYGNATATLLDRRIEGDEKTKDRESRWMLSTILTPFLAMAAPEIVDRLYDRFGSLGAILAAQRAQLCSVGGVNPTIADHLEAIGRLNALVLREEIRERPAILSYEILNDYLRISLQHNKTECILGLFLDVNNRLIKDELLAAGTIDQVMIYPREVARRTIELQAKALILVHNHPSGSPTPSAEDIDTTRRIIQAINAIGAVLHDHLIVAGGEVVSLRKSNLL